MKSSTQKIRKGERKLKKARESSRRDKSKKGRESKTETKEK